MRPTIEVVQRYGQVPPIECYAGQLNQVFMNILSNAIDALEEAWRTPAAGEAASLESPPEASQLEASQSEASQPAPQAAPQITIETEVVDSAVSIRISDNGLGIALVDQARLFDPFFTTKPIGKGTGMGLSISYQIITEHHGGRLSCESALGQGTTFVITIPRTLGAAPGA